MKNLIENHALGCRHVLNTVSLDSIVKYEFRNKNVFGSPMSECYIRLENFSCDEKEIYTIITLSKQNLIDLLKQFD